MGMFTVQRNLTPPDSEAGFLFADTFAFEDPASLGDSTSSTSYHQANIATSIIPDNENNGGL